ncbi:MAG: zinc-ribbon domain-containing protein [Deltaproteobacteria bacterium]|nr:zinc-ribbon domain-containing protein [Deltaproteobacteria bacterium]
MIIQCDKCATKFRLDDSRITPSGVKVRCTKCDNVFIVTPPPPPEEVQVEELFGVVPGMDDKAARPAASGLQAKTQPPKQKEDDKHLAFDFDSEVTREDIFKTPEDTPPQDDGKDFGFSQGLPPEQKSEDGKKLSLDDLDFSFSQDLSNEKKNEEDGWGASEEDLEDDPFSGAFDKPLTSEDDVNTEEASGSGINAEAGVDKSDFDFNDIAESTKPSEPWAGEQTEAAEQEPRKPVTAENVIPFSAAAYTKEGKTPAPVKSGADEPAETDEAFKAYLTKAVEKNEPLSFDSPDEEEEEEEDLRAPHRAGQPRMGLIIAALVVVLGGGLIYFTGVIDKLTHILMPPAEVKVVEIESIKGFYEENKNFGKLFVIDARVKNITDTPQEIKAATGVIYNDSGDKIAERSVAPGRILAIDDVRNLQKEELERAFRDPSGGIIPARGSVPVMVLFIEIPEGLSEFGLDIVK